MTDTIQNTSVLRTNVYSQEIKLVLDEELIADPLVDWKTDFPDGTTLKIPTLSQMTVRDYEEGGAIKIDETNTGDFELTIDKYYEANFAITDKFRDDSFYVSQVEAGFVAELTKAIARQKESDIFNLQSSQTASNANTINGAAHRIVCTGTSQAITLADISSAKFALDKSNVSRVGRKGVFDPAMTQEMLTISNVLAQDVYGANSHLKEGMSGTVALGKFHGFDLFESNLLDNGLAETITGSVTAGIANIMVGEEAFVGAMRTMPTVESFRQHERKRDVHSATIRYGIKLYRPESLVVLLAE